MSASTSGSSPIQCSGDYDKAIASVLDKAITFVEVACGKRGEARLVLDIDETSLSNWPGLVTNDFSLIMEGPCDQAIPGACGSSPGSSMPGTKPSCQRWSCSTPPRPRASPCSSHRPLRCRSDAQGDVANLKAAGYDGWAELVLRPAESCAKKLDSVDAFKAPERARSRPTATPSSPMSAINGATSMAVTPQQNYKVPNPYYFIK